MLLLALFVLFSLFFMTLKSNAFLFMDLIGHFKGVSLNSIDQTVYFFGNMKLFAI